MSEPKRRAVDDMTFGRETDKVWNPEAEISSHEMIFAMYRSQIELNKRVTEHMANEETERGVMNGKLQVITDSVKPIIDSMPRDAQGQPSPFLHRIHHETGSAIYRSGLFQEGLRYLFLAVLILASTGNLSAFFKHIIG